MESGISPIHSGAYNRGSWYELGWFRNSALSADCRLLCFALWREVLTPQPEHLENGIGSNRDLHIEDFILAI
jgi:hypothetical protein